MKFKKVCWCGYECRKLVDRATATKCPICGDRQSWEFLVPEYPPERSTKIKRYDWRKDPEAVMIPLRRAVAWRKWQERASHQPPFEYGHRTEK